MIIGTNTDIYSDTIVAIDNTHTATHNMLTHTTNASPTTIDATNNHGDATNNTIAFTSIYNTDVDDTATNGARIDTVETRAMYTNDTTPTTSAIANTTTYTNHTCTTSCPHILHHNKHWQIAAIRSIRNTRYGWHTFDRYSIATAYTTIASATIATTNHTNRRRI